MTLGRYLLHTLIMLAIIPPLKLILVALLTSIVFSSNKLALGLQLINLSVFCVAFLYTVVQATGLTTAIWRNPAAHPAIIILSGINSIILAVIITIGIILVLMTSESETLYSSSLVLEFRENILKVMDHASKSIKP